MPMRYDFRDNYTCEHRRDCSTIYLKIPVYEVFAPVFIKQFENLTINFEERKPSNGFGFAYIEHNIFDDPINDIRMFCEYLIGKFIITLRRGETDKDVETFIDCGLEEAVDICFSLGRFWYNELNIKTELGAYRDSMLDGDNKSYEYIKNILIEAIDKIVILNTDYITYIPSSRGNSCKNIAIEISERLDIEYIEIFDINRKIATRDIDDISNKIEANKRKYKINHKLENQTSILIIDDIIQSGATFWVCSHLLKNNGWSIVRCLAPCHTARR